MLKSPIIKSAAILKRTTLNENDVRLGDQRSLVNFDKKPHIYNNRLILHCLAFDTKP